LENLFFLPAHPGSYFMTGLLPCNEDVVFKKTFVFHYSQWCTATIKKSSISIASKDEKSSSPKTYRKVRK
jgi:hypothetical protein